MMTISEIKVGISDYKIAHSPDKLITVGLGSCIGTLIYDERSKIGGLSHIMLPDSHLFMDIQTIKSAKFADLAIPEMVQELTQEIRRPHLKAKIVGGASMFQFTTLNTGPGIGDRNIEAVEKILAAQGIPIIASHVGGTVGRTMIADLNDFSVIVKIVNQQMIQI